MLAIYFSWWFVTFCCNELMAYALCMLCYRLIYPDIKGPGIYIDLTSMRHFCIGSMPNKVNPIIFAIWIHTFSHYILAIECKHNYAHHSKSKHTCCWMQKKIIFEISKLGFLFIKLMDPQIKIKWNTLYISRIIDEIPTLSVFCGMVLASFTHNPTKKITEGTLSDMAERVAWITTKLISRVKVTYMEMTV